ncbi:MAG TPA: polysaccharide ABC transporter ATP-binding protein [Pyrinomonadaceae bacterium]|nr:polysaccharide ABC transporter ATP-binding protein [Pyrinomonadaceae bacterium]
MKPIIKVENLGKQYQIGAKPESYLTFREAIISSLRKPLNFFKNQDSEKDRFWALRDLSFEIMPGDIVGIIGRNGAGKSTLLKILSRITEPTVGKAELYGRVGSLLEVGTGFHPELTGRENVFLNGAILGMGRQEIAKKFDEIVDFAEVEKFIDTPVKRYSSGMYMRLAFAIAANLEPEILVVDEVLAVGDAEFQKKCLGKMDEVSKGGRTVLFVSHNMGTILQLCKHCILLEKGKVLAEGPPSEIVEKYYNNEKTHSYTKTHSDSDIFLKQAYTCDKDGNPQTNIGHKEDIRLRLVIGVNNFLRIQNVAVCLLRQDKKRVFTVNKSLEGFYREGSDEVTVDFIIEGGLIAPMDYSFLIALNTRTGTITYDWHDDICPIKVFDDGTDFSFAEGYDYGCIILKDKWELINN